MIILTQTSRSGFRESENSVFYFQSEPSTPSVSTMRYSMPNKWVSPLPRAWPDNSSLELSAVDNHSEKRESFCLDSDHSDSSEENLVRTAPLSLLRQTALRKKQRRVILEDCTPCHPLTSSTCGVTSSSDTLPSNQLANQPYTPPSSRSADEAKRLARCRTALSPMKKPAVGPIKPPKMTLRLKISMPHILTKKAWKPAATNPPLEDASVDVFKTDFKASDFKANDFAALLSISNDNLPDDNTDTQDGEEMVLYENRTAPLTLNPQRRFCRINPDFLRVVVAKREMYHNGKLNYVSCPQFRSPRMDDIPKRPKVIEQMGISVGWTRSFRRNWRELTENDFS